MVDRIKALCRAQNTSVTKLEALLGFGNGTIGKWRTAKNAPPVDRLQKVADALGVSLRYLLTGEPDEKSSPSKIESELTDLQKHAMSIALNMSVEALELFIRVSDDLEKFAELAKKIKGEQP